MSILAVCHIVSIVPARAEVFFVDGYHGGIYGHYPVEWKTQFIVDQLNNNPGWNIGLEIEPETWDTVRVHTPEAYIQFGNLLKRGRMEYTNPTYAQPYCYNIQGESLIQQFRYGIDKLREHFPGITFTTYAVEEPCFTSCLPAVLKGFGFKYASLKCPNTCWGGYMAPYGGQLVDWIGPDGTSLLTVPRYGCEKLEKHSVWQTTAWGNSPGYLKACKKAGIENPVGMCYQDAGWRNGPWLGPDGKGSTYVLWSDYIEKHTSLTTGNRYFMSQDDIRVNLMWGSQVLQRIARQVRHAENSMLMAEKIGFIVAADSGTLPDRTTLDEAWRQLMLAQHHDSWIVPYNRLWNYGTWADAIKLWTSHADHASQSEIERLAGKIDQGNKLMVKVFNTTLLTRHEVVSVELPEAIVNKRYTAAIIDADGKVLKSEILHDDRSGKNMLIFTASVPPSGYSTYTIQRTAKHSGNDTLPDDGNLAVLDNGLIRLEIDLTKGGTIKSLKLKEGDNLEFAPADTCGRSLCELRGFFYSEGRFRSSAEKPARIISSVSNDLINSMTVAGEIAGHPFELTYSLTAGSPRIDCSLRIDWKGNPGIGEYREKNWNHDRRAFCDDRYKLCLLLPTSFNADRLWKDAPFDVCESKQESTVFKRWSEIKHNIILNWIDFTDTDKTTGMGILTDHTTSYVHSPGYPTALTIQYSGQGLWGPDYRISGPTELSFALLPHIGTGGAEAMWAEADRYNEPLHAVVSPGSGRPSSRSFADIDTEGYRLSYAMATDSNKLTLRLHNVCASHPGELTLKTTCDKIYETDLLDNKTGDVTLSRSNGTGRMTVEIPRNGFRTFAITTR